MRKRMNPTLPPLTDVSVLQMAKELDPQKARSVEFLLMELNSDQGELSRLVHQMRQPRPYEELIDLMVELKILCSIIADRSSRLEAVLDEIVDLAPDPPEE